MGTVKATGKGAPAPPSLRTMRPALGQVAPRLGDVAANLEQHLEMIDAGRGEGARVVLFPEPALTGYQLKDLVPDVALDGRSPALARLVAASRGLGVGFGFVEESSDHRFYNSYAYCEDGRLVHVHRKVYLPTYGLFGLSCRFSLHSAPRDVTAGDYWGPVPLRWLTRRYGGPSRGDAGVASVAA